MLSTHQAFEKILRELIQELGQPDAEDLPIIRRLFDAGVVAGRREVFIKSGGKDQSATAAPAANTQEVCRSPGPKMLTVNLWGEEKIFALSHDGYRLSASEDGEGLSAPSVFEWKHGNHRHSDQIALKLMELLGIPEMRSDDPAMLGKPSGQGN